MDGPPASTADHSLARAMLRRRSNLYLLAYNSVQAFGWTLSLCIILSSFVSIHSFNGAYASAGELICLLQTVSFVEVLHGAIGIVPSGILLPLMQWGGRTHFLLAIVRHIVEVQELLSVFITFVAWSLSEVIRYSHHALNCMGSCPSWIIYLRYTAFIVLYPVGVAPGEMWLMYQALPFIKKKNLYADFFAGLPFSYYHFVWVLFLCYPFLWLKLYLHLFKQRQSKLSKCHEKKRK
ncbi:uncharacterized protein LOC131148486 [Malania oleifera]|uniref:uncharacterized protein LOC131148486 n=1 Tax=Malania oleifera TaxID=397392 RepID=UPI0025ADC9D6|nr:uncharacterized protein LOC131148486 [Malania oleifera]